MSKMYFIAIVAPAAINEPVLKWKNYMKEHFGCVVGLRSPAHITLVPPFWMDETLETELRSEITSFSKQKTAFEINLKNFGAFKPRVIYISVLPNETLKQMQAELIDSLISKEIFPIIKEDRPFTAHLTIATRDLHKKAFREAWELFKEKNYEASWLAEGISLLVHDEKKWEVVYTSPFKNV